MEFNSLPFRLHGILKLDVQVGFKGSKVMRYSLYSWVVVKNSQPHAIGRQRMFSVGSEGLASTFREACIDGALLLPRTCVFTDELSLSTVRKPDYFLPGAWAFSRLYLSVAGELSKISCADKTNEILFQDSVTELVIFITLWVTIFQGEDFPKG